MRSEEPPGGITLDRRSLAGPGAVPECSNRKDGPGEPALNVALALLAGILLIFGTNCAPALHATARAPVALQHEVSSFESSGHRIRVDVYRPGEARRGERAPAVIVIHGSSGVHRVLPNTATRYARALAEQGIVAVVVHYFDITGTILADLASEEEHYYVWEGVLKDAVTWVGKLPEVDPNEIGVLGHSLGAFLAVGLASSDRRVSKVVLFGGGLEPFLQEQVERMPPTVVFHGDKDGEVPLSEAQNLVDVLRARGCDVELRVLPGEGHTFSESAVTEALTDATRFFLRPVPGETMR